MRSIRLLMIAAFGVLAPGAASAHAFLEKGVPGAQAKVAVSPKVLELTFDQPLQQNQITATVLASDGHKVASSADRGTTMGWTTLTVPLPVLPPGAYTVTWHCSMGLGHETEGKYVFTITGGPPH